MSEPSSAPRVSVVIPAYNRAGTLGRAIDSVRGQEVADWELIVVDDGSGDGTATVAEAYGDARIRLVRHPANRGAAAARNTGIAAARGRYVAFLDSDDEWCPGKLAAQLAVLESEGVPDILCTGFILRRNGSDGASERFPRPHADKDWFAAMLDGCHVSPGSTLIARRAVFAEVGPLDETLRRLEDWDWLLRALAVFRFDCLPMLGAIIHVGGPPKAAAVDAATKGMLARHAEPVLRMAGPAGLARFRASLAVERAVAALYEHRILDTAWHLGGAFRHSPERTMRFLRQAAGKRITRG